MTRGKVILFKDDKAIVSTEFNGDMYPTGHPTGDRTKSDGFLGKLEKAETDEDFKELVNFINLSFEYKDSEMYWDLSLDEVETDFNKDYFENWFSDWLYFKNASEKTIDFLTTDGETCHLMPGKWLAFNFGCRPKFKTKDDEYEKREATALPLDKSDYHVEKTNIEFIVEVQGSIRS